MNDRTRKALNIILSIVLAIGAWTYVVYNYVPNTNVTYKDIPIIFKGEDALASRGYGISGVSRDTVSVTLNQKRVNSNELSSDDITVIADVSNATQGDNGISLEISSPEGTSVVEKDARTINVTVERADSRTVDVIVAYEDSPDNTIEPDVSNISSSRATIVGARSEIDSVDKAVAFLDTEETTENSRNFTRALECVDEEGNVIPHIVVYPSEVKFDATLGYIKTVPLKVNVRNDSKDSYERTFTAPSYVQIRGSESLLREINEVETTDIDLNVYYEDAELSIRYVLPDGVSIANASRDEKILVKVTKVSQNKEETTEGE